MKGTGAGVGVGSLGASCGGQIQTECLTRRAHKQTNRLASQWGKLNLICSVTQPVEFCWDVTRDASSVKNSRDVMRRPLFQTPHHSLHRVVYGDWPVPWKLCTTSSIYFDVGVDATCVSNAVHEVPCVHASRDLSALTNFQC